MLSGDRAELSRLYCAIKRRDGMEAISDRVADALSADATICACLPGGALIAVGYVKTASFGGGVDPTYRRRGLGRRLL